MFVRRRDDRAVDVAPEERLDLIDDAVDGLRGVFGVEVARHAALHDLQRDCGRRLLAELLDGFLDDLGGLLRGRGGLG